MRQGKALPVPLPLAGNNNQRLPGYRSLQAVEFTRHIHTSVNDQNSFGFQSIDQIVIARGWRGTIRSMVR